jgi:hypothetical protein
MGVNWLATSVLATVTMDVSRVLFIRLRLIGPTPGNFAPRWIASVVRGHVVHKDISTVPPVPGELPTFLVVHYLIGLVLGALYLQLAGREAGNFLWAALYGVATCALPWLLMFPAMGYGPFGLRFQGTPIRATLLFHLAFGLALALWWRVLGGWG